MTRYDINGVTLDVPDAFLNDRLSHKLASGGYEAHEARAALMRLRPGQRVLELGAGLGYIATLCAGVVGASNVVSVEANPGLLPVIRANLDANGQGAVTLLHGAVAGPDSDDDTIIFDPSRCFWAGHLAESGSDTARLVTVPLLRLDGLLAAHRPHLVIMDIEGAEQYLFDAPWPGFVRAVMMELHPRRYDDSVIKRIVDCLSASGLTYDPGPSRGAILCFRRVRGA